MNKVIIGGIVLVIVGVGGFLIYRAVQPSDTTQTQVTPTPTSSGVIISQSTTPTVSTAVITTSTPTPSTTGTVTPTPTITSAENFDQDLDKNWVYGYTEQQANGKTYFLDSANPLIIKAGTSKTDSGATTVFTSDSGPVATFNVLGSSIIIALKRNVDTNETKLVRYFISTNRTSLLYKYVSSKFNVVNFSIQKDGTTTMFYLGLDGVDQKYQPMVMYVKQYAQEWVKTLDGSKKEDKVAALGITTDAKNIKVKLTPVSGDAKTILVPLPTPTP